jgi:hypothetical protein
VRLIVLGRRGAPPRPRSATWAATSSAWCAPCTVPILTVTEGFTEPERVMFAFDGGAMTRRGVEVVAASPLFRDLPILLFMSGKRRQRRAARSSTGPRRS